MNISSVSSSTYSTSSSNASTTKALEKQIASIQKEMADVDMKPMMIQILSANRSCIFDIEILITVNYSNTTTWAKFSGIELFVSSIYGPSIIDGELIGKGYDVYDNDIVYFPYK